MAHWRREAHAGSKARQGEGWLCVTPWGKGVERGRRNDGLQVSLSGTAAPDSSMVWAYRRTGSGRGRQQLGFTLQLVFPVADAMATRLGVDVGAEQLRHSSWSAWLSSSSRSAVSGGVGVTGDGELHLLQLDAVVARDMTGSPDVGSSLLLCCCCACVRETEGEKLGFAACDGKQTQIRESKVLASSRRRNRREGSSGRRFPAASLLAGEEREQRSGVWWYATMLLAVEGEWSKGWRRLAVGEEEEWTVAAAWEEIERREGEG
jgi:hypothetical protein